MKLWGCRVCVETKSIPIIPGSIKAQFNFFLNHRNTMKLYDMIKVYSSGFECNNAGLFYI